MGANTNVNRTSTRDETARGIRRRAAQIVITMLIQVAIMFGAAGSLNWGMAWAFIGVQLGVLAANSFVLLRKDPALIAERAQGREGAKNWDKVLALIVSLIGPLSVYLVSGLDRRYGWSQPPALAVELISLLVVALGYALWGWAMASNRYFSGLVRIQKERGHTVSTAGPYRLVRHPGYAGLILWTLATPLALGTLWAFVPAGLTVVAIVVRTALEDSTLRKELAGYDNYARQVRYRLLPGVW